MAAKLPLSTFLDENQLDADAIATLKQLAQRYELIPETRITLRELPGEIGQWLRSLRSLPHDTTKPGSCRRASPPNPTPKETAEETTMNPKLFKQINEFLARQMYAPDTSEAMRKSARDARNDLFRLFGTNNNPVRLHKMQTARSKLATS